MIMNHQRRRERPALRRVSARERGAARKGEEIKKFVRASAEPVKTEGQEFPFSIGKFRRRAMYIYTTLVCEFRVVGICICILYI